MTRHQRKNTTIYRQMLSGDATPADLITNNIAFVDHLVRCHLNRWPHDACYEGDLRGEGLLALTEAAESIATVRPDDCTIYLGRLIGNAMRREAYQHAKHDRHEKRERFPTDHADADHQTANETAADIETLCRDVIDRQIVRLIREGHTREQIALRLKIGRQTIADRLNRIETLIAGQPKPPKGQSDAG
jgi:DNA-directed RNA polymerase specialized sigma subunit